MRYWILIIFLVNISQLAAKDIIWEGHKDFINISKEVYYLKDENDAFTIQDITSDKFIDKFSKNDKNIINFGFTDRSYWLRFDIENTSDDDLLLELKQPYLEIADFYYRGDSTNFHLLSSGYNVSMDDRVIRHHTPVFPLPHNIHHVYLKIHILAHSVPILLWEKSKFEKKATIEKLIYGLVTGLFVFVLLNNLMFFISLRNPIYLLYSLVVLLFVANCAATMDGFILYLYPRLDLGFWYGLLPSMALPLTPIFIIYFLDTKKQLPGFFKIGKMFSLILIFYFLIHWFLPRLLVFNLNPLLVILSFFLMGYISLKSYKSGNKIALFICIAYVFFLISVILETCYILTGRPGYFLEISHASTGMLLESFFYSIALAQKFEWERAETEKGKLLAQSQIIEKTRENEKIVREQNQMLEEQVSIRTLELNESKKIAEVERQKSDALLLNILPAEIAEELRQKGTSTAHSYEEATVLFADIKDFTRICSQFTPETMIKELDYIFGAFDKIIDKHNIEKIKVIGDAYMCAGGIPIPNSNSAFDVVNAAMEIQLFMQEMRAQRAALHQQQYEIRIGINTGPLVAGIIGVKKFTYDIWGDTVNVASRLEENGEENKINISENTYQIIKDYYQCERRGNIEVKGKGNVSMYFVHGLKGEVIRG